MLKGSIYRTVAKRVIALAETSSFCLVARMAAEIAALCLEEPQVRRATVRVEKPGALRFALSVGVEIERNLAGWEARRPANHVFVSMGSNIEPEHYLLEAVRRLAERCQLLAVGSDRRGGGHAYV